jgi:hypothetical protein
MTRTGVLAQYRPIRAGIRRVLREATKACGRADLNRAVKQVAPWAEAAEIEDDKTAEMLVDIALCSSRTSAAGVPSTASSPSGASAWRPPIAPWPSE